MLLAVVKKNQSKVVELRRDLSSSCKHDYRLPQDTQILTSIFPPEVWKHQIVSGHLVNNPDEKERLINSSPYFREMLSDSRVLFLVRKVLKVLCTWHLKGKEEPVANPYHKLGYLLKCRQVCSTWCYAFDDLIEQQFLDWKVISPDGVISTREDMTNFVAHFVETHPPHLVENCRTPFIGRLLLVDSNFEDGAGQYWEDLLSLLHIYGSHIWHLKFVVTERCVFGGLSDQQIYLKFREVLTLLPSLKSLWVEWECSWDVGKHFIQWHPLPRLVNLKSLKIGLCPHPVLFWILRENDHVSSLNVCFRDEMDLRHKVEGMNEQPAPWLDFIYDPLGLYIPRVAQTGFIDSQLRKLDFELKPTTLFRWSNVFRMISYNWGCNLKELNLFLPISDPQKCFQDSLNWSLYLPKVKVLGLRTDLYAISIDFLLGMRSLEAVRISSITKERSESYRKSERGFILDAAKRAKVKFVGHEVVMYESNIWSMFGNLHILEVEGKMYRNEMYCNHNARDYNL